MRCNDDESEPERKVMSFGNDRSSYALKHPGKTPWPGRVVRSLPPSDRPGFVGKPLFSAASAFKPKPFKGHCDVRPATDAV